METWLYFNCYVHKHKINIDFISKYVLEESQVIFSTQYVIGKAYKY